MAHPAFARSDHRPLPLPARPWTSSQSWRDLLFMHWRVPVEQIRPWVPSRLDVQQRDGSAWIAVVPFRMAGVRPRGLPPVPGLSAFPELNVRTYVECDGVPGIWFLSLDATNPVAIWAARRFFRLPYHRARMALEPAGDAVRYSSERVDESSARFRARYRAVSPVAEPRPGSLEYWLTERYCLFSQSLDGGLNRVDVHHHPWPLRTAEAKVETNTMLDPYGIDVSESDPLLHFASRLDVAVWWPKPV